MVKIKNIRQLIQRREYWFSSIFIPLFYDLDASTFNISGKTTAIETGLNALILQYLPASKEKYFCLNI